MSGGSDVLIVGGGLAGCTVAGQLAQAGRAGDVTIFEAEPEAPYDRPPLTKSFLASEDLLSAWPVWAPRDVEWRYDAVDSIDLARRAIVTRSGEVLTASTIVIAVGARARILPQRSDRIRTIRTAADARVLRDQVASGANRFLIEGAGPLGLEIASTLASAGVRVTVVDPAPAPMMRLLGGHLSDDVNAWAEESGVELLLGCRVTESHDTDSPTGVLARIGDGPLEAYDGLVSAVGIEANPLELHGTTGPVTSPILADEHGRILDPEGLPIDSVFAVGDIVGFRQPDGSIARSEAWSSARVQGEAIARHLLGKPSLQAPVPYFWTRQFGRMIQVLGEVGPGSEIKVAREVPGATGKLYRVARDGVPVGYIGVNAQRLVAQLQVQGGKLAHWRLGDV